MYESQGDWDKEKKAISVLEKSYGAKAKKLPISYGLDYALVGDHDKILGFFEIKSRSNSSKMYDTLYISAHKRMAAQKLTESTGRPCYILAGYTDGIYLVNFKDEPVMATISGRTDRGDSADIEPCVHFSQSQQKCISTINVHEVDHA
jgi:hypothetical protein